MGKLVLKRASASRLSGEWGDDDYDVLADGKVAGRIMKAAAAPVGTPWLLRLSRGPNADPRLRGDARGCDGGLRQELATAIAPRRRWRGRWRDHRWQQALGDRAIGETRLAGLP
jgi:hypothetical protein